MVLRLHHADHPVGAERAGLPDHLAQQPQPETLCPASRPRPVRRSPSPYCPAPPTARPSPSRSRRRRQHATIETPPAGADRCRAVREVSFGIGTWYRRVRLSYEHRSCIATTASASSTVAVRSSGTPPLPGRGPSGVSSRSASRPAISTSTSARAHSAGVYSSNPCRLLQLLVDRHRVVDQPQYGAQVPRRRVVEYVGLARADRRTAAAGLRDQRGQVVGGPADAGRDDQLVDRAGLGGEDLQVKDVDVVRTTPCSEFGQRTGPVGEFGPDLPEHADALPRGNVLPLCVPPVARPGPECYARVNVSGGPWAGFSACGRPGRRRIRACRGPRAAASSG